SRRRHTRCLSDWSSDVCSSDLKRRKPQSDLGLPGTPGRRHAGLATLGLWSRMAVEEMMMNQEVMNLFSPQVPAQVFDQIRISIRSEERRVGKECRAWEWRSAEL